MHSLNADPGRPEGLRKACAYALFVVLALVAVQCARLGAAGLLAQLAETDVEQWRKERQPVSLEKANRVAAQLAASLRVAPDNPWTLEKLGLVELAKIG